MQSPDHCNLIIPGKTYAIVMEKLVVFKWKSSVFLGDSFNSLIPADVADFKKAFLYYIAKYSKGKCCYIMYMSRYIKIV